MHRWQALIRTVAAAALLSVSTAVLAADETKGKDEARRAAPAWLPTIDCGEMSGWFKSQCTNLGAAWTRGRPLVMLSGYTWHDPSTYDDDKLESFNSESWGGGFGFGRSDDKGDHYSWYTMAFKDSHYDWTVMAGWAWTTYWPERSDFAVGLGYTAFLMSRPDIFNNVPFPAVLPIASVKLGPAELMGTFIPKLNGGVNHGNVGFLFGRVQF